MDRTRSCWLWLCEGAGCDPIVTERGANPVKNYGTLRNTGIVLTAANSVGVNRVAKYQA